MNTEKVSRFFRLQEMVNFQISLTGSASLEAADELEELVDSLNDKEIDYILDTEVEKPKTLTDLEIAIKLEEIEREEVMKTFKDLEFIAHPTHMGGVQARMDFDNTYGVSVVCTPYTYGGDRGLYELAVLKDGHIHYDNPVANGDVVGYLRPEDVSDAMLVIQKF